MIPSQIRVLRKQRDWSQQDLAKYSSLTQGVISRAEDPDYGNLTVNTLVKVAAGFDCAFIGRFVPFSQFARWYDGLDHEKSLEVPSFAEDTEPNFVDRKAVERSVRSVTASSFASPQREAGALPTVQYKLAFAASQGVDVPMASVVNISAGRRNRVGNRQGKASGRTARSKAHSIRGVRGALGEQRSVRVDPMEPKNDLRASGFVGQSSLAAYGYQHAVAPS
jgi:transcriptional regulator with XRE-family HTH domain